MKMIFMLSFILFENLGSLANLFEFFAYNHALHNLFVFSVDNTNLELACIGFDGVHGFVQNFNGQFCCLFQGAAIFVFILEGVDGVDAFLSSCVGFVGMVVS